jgi:hypothetical protein
MGALTDEFNSLKSVDSDECFPMKSLGFSGLSGRVNGRYAGRMPEAPIPPQPQSRQRPLALARPGRPTKLRGGCAVAAGDSERFQHGDFALRPARPHSNPQRRPGSPETFARPGGPLPGPPVRRPRRPRPLRNRWNLSPRIAAGSDDPGRHGALRKAVIQTLDRTNALGLEHPCVPGGKLKFPWGNDRRWN